MKSKVFSFVQTLANSWRLLTQGELFLLFPGDDPQDVLGRKMTPEIKNLFSGNAPASQVVIGKQTWRLATTNGVDPKFSLLTSAMKDGPWDELLHGWISLLSDLSREAAISNDLVVELVKAWDRLSFLFELTKIAGRSSGQREMLHMIVDSLAEVVDAGDIIISVDSVGGRMTILSSDVDFSIPNELYLKIKQAPSLMSYSEVKRIYPKAEMIYADVDDLIIAPLPAPEGAYGLIGFVKSNQGEYDASEAQLLASVAEHIGALIEASQARHSREEAERLERELSIASDIQSNLLPIRLPEITGCDLSAHLQPARRIGGDFYDVAHLRTGEPILMLADVSGKGMPAAILTAVVHATFHGEAPYQRDPAQLLAEINRSIYPDLDKAQAFVTAAVARIDSDPLKVAYSSAGHVEAAIWRKRREWIEFLPATGLPLGVQRVLSCRTKEATLEPGDVLLLYSDGVTEAENRDGEVFGAQRLSDIMEAVHPAAAADQIPIILKAVETFCRDLPLRDDLTMVLVRAEDDDVDETIIPFVFSSDTNAISPFVEWAWRKISPFVPAQGTPNLVDEFTLALSEVVTNQSKHAYDHLSGLIMGRLSLSSKEWRVDLFDRGEGFDPFSGEELIMDLDDPPMNGYGLRIIQSALDTYKYERLHDNRNHWTLTKSLGGEERA